MADQNTAGASSADSSSILHHIPARCWFSPQCAEQQVILDTIAAAQASKIAKKDVISFLQSSLEPTILLHPKVIGNPRIFHALNDFLESSATGHNSIEYPAPDLVDEPTNRRKVIKTLYGNQIPLILRANEIIESTESLMFLPTSQVSLTEPTSCSTSPFIFDAVQNENDARQKRALNIAARFSSVEDKYDGLHSSDLRIVESRMNDAILDFQLDQEEARKYVHNCFTGKAKHLYETDQEIRSATRVDQVFDLMRGKFAFSEYREATTSMLDHLNIAEELQLLSLREALDKIRETIEASMPNVIESRNGDRDAGFFLRKAVMSEEWAKPACELFVQDTSISFWQLHAMLGSAIEEREAAATKAQLFTQSDEFCALQNASEEAVQEDEVHFAAGSYAGMYTRIPRSVHRSRRHTTKGRRAGRSRTAYRRRVNRRVRATVDRICSKCGLNGHSSLFCTSHSTFTRDGVRSGFDEGGEDSNALYETFYSQDDEFDDAMSFLEEESQYDYEGLTENVPQFGALLGPSKQGSPKKESKSVLRK